MDKFILLMCDTETGNWHINLQTSDAKFARSEYKALKKNDNETPTILIDTTDFVTI